MRELATAVVFLLSATITFGEDARSDTLEINRIAEEIAQAVKEEDVRKVLTYVSPAGTVFIDAGYTRQEIVDLLSDEKSWLYEHLFTSKKSVKNYFDTAIGVNIRVHRRGKDAAMISYVAANKQPEDWAECCLIKTKGRWYFDGIFYCE